EVVIAHLGRHEPPPLRKEVPILGQLHLKNAFRNGVHPKTSEQGLSRIDPTLRSDWRRRTPTLREAAHALEGRKERKAGGRKSGICLVIAITLEAIQQRFR